MSANDDSLLVDAEVLAGEYEVDKSAIHTALRKIGEAREYFPREPVYELRTALDCAPPERVLKLFQDEAAEIISVKVVWYYYLSSPLTPLYTRPHLSRLLREFVRYLEHNEDYLLKTGHPRTRFDASPWLDWHLARTYYVKRPIIIAPERSQFAELFSPPMSEYLAPPKHDTVGNTFHQYYWIKARQRPPFRIERREQKQSAGGDLSLVQIPQETTDFHTTGEGIYLPHDDRGPLQSCKFCEAGDMEGFEPEDVVWLRKRRPKLLELKKHILRRLRAALDHEDPNGLWEDIGEILTSSLSQQETERLIEAERLYGSTSSLMVPLWSMDVPPFYENNGGLTELLSVVGYVEKELRIGTMHGAKEVIEDEEEALRLSHYYQAVDQPWRPTLDQAIVTLFGLSVEEDGFWKDYEDRVAKLWPRFKSEVTVSRLVASDKARKLLSYLEQKADWARVSLEQTGEIQERPSLAEAAAGQYVFRKTDDYWTIAYEGHVLHLRHLKGFFYLARLLRQPGREFHVLDLVGEIEKRPLPPIEQADAYEKMTEEELAEEEGLFIGGLGDAGPLLDEESKEYYKGRLADIEDELDEAKRFGDQGKIEKLEDEKQAIIKYVSSAIGLGGRERRSASAAERARVNVQKRIRFAIKQLSEKSSRLGLHLETAINTGPFCCYTPDPHSRIPWEF